MIKNFKKAIDFLNPKLVTQVKIWLFMEYLGREISNKQTFAVFSKKINKKLPKDDFS